MTTQVTFNGTTHTRGDLEALKGSELVKLYNDVAQHTDGSTVNRFATKTAAVKRVWEQLEAYAAQRDEAAPEAEAAPEPVTTTDNEFTALVECLNYSDREAQLSDNFSNGGHDAFKKRLGWNDQQVAALIGSLEAKGLVYSDNEGVNGNKFNTVWLTEKAVHHVFDELDAGRAPVKPEPEPTAEPKPVKKPAPKAEKKADTERARKGTNIQPGEGKPVACREGTKQALLLDMLARPQGATMEELLDALSGGKKPWTEASVRSGFGWDMKQKGYGVRSSFDKQGVERFHIVLPTDKDGKPFAIPPHRPLKNAPKADARQKNLGLGESQ